MSSWQQSAVKRRLLPIQYNQGTCTEKQKSPTVVSAYYKFSSKFDDQTYRSWIQNLLSLPFYLVFFTDEASIDYIQSCREHYKDKTRLIILSKDEWTATSQFKTDFWENQRVLDPEQHQHNHTADLYKIWYEKKEFVRRAIELNPFDHDDFVWTDAGIVREPMELQNYPQATKIPTDRLLLLNVAPFEEGDQKQIAGIPGRFAKKNRIGGGILAGSRSVWSDFSKQYDSMVELYSKEGRFVGKDQSIIASLVMLDQTKFCLIKPVKGGNQWLYLLHYLS